MDAPGLHDFVVPLMRRLTEADLATIEGDAKFFRRRQHRSHRLRVSSQAEIEAALLLERRPPAPFGCAWYTIVKQLSPEVRACWLIVRAEGFDCDVPDDIAREIFERAVGSLGVGK